MKKMNKLIKVKDFIKKLLTSLSTYTFIVFIFTMAVLLDLGLFKLITMSMNAVTIYPIATITVPKKEIIKEEVKEEVKEIKKETKVYQNVKLNVEQEEMKKLIIKEAEKRNFPYTNYLVKLAFFESSLKAKVESGKNKNGTIDVGIFQINDCHKISKNKRKDPIFATNWAMDKILAGGQGIWTQNEKAKNSNIKFY